MIVAGLVLLPYGGWVVLAIWLSGFARGLHERLARGLGGRVQLAAVITVFLLSTVLVPLGAVITILVIDAVALLADLAQSDQVRSVLVTLVSNDRPEATEASIGRLILAQGERALDIIRTVFASAAQIVIGLVILMIGIFTLLVDGRRWYAWAEDHAPMSRQAVHRFANAFVETGRGLAFGMIGAGVLQAVLATGAYLVLGVPQALPLGLLTLVFSIVPLVGTALVWVPVAAGLALTGRTYEAIGLAIFGIVVISSIDNLARPYLTRYGKLQLPMFLVLVAMFGAVKLIGGWGILFGPLAIRMGKEALEVRRDALA